MVRQLALPYAETDIVIKRLIILRFGSAFKTHVLKLSSITNPTFSTRMNTLLNNIK